jgi:hypothetical protein
MNDPTTDPTSDPTTDPTSDPTADPTSDPTADPTSEAPGPDYANTTAHDLGATTPVPTAAATTPFRVEPSTPVPDDRVATEPTPAPTASTAWQPPAGPPAAAPAPVEQGGLVTVRKGPRPGAITLGLLSMIIAAYVLTANLTDTDLNLRVLAPTTFGALGVVFLVVGLVGVLAGSRRR